MTIATLVEEMRESNYIAAENNHIIGNIHEHLQSESLKQEQNRLDDLEARRDSTEGSAYGGSAGSAPVAGAKPEGSMKKALAAGVAVGAKGVGMGVGLAALGFGIGGFFTGLAMGDKLQAMIGTDMTATKQNMITLGEAFAETPDKGLLIMAGIMTGGGALGALFGVKSAAKAAIGMTAMGAGLGGFFAGLALGDKGMGLLKVDGEQIKNMMIAMGTGLNAFDDSALIALGGLAAIGAVLPPSSAVKLPAFGIGLAGFFTALAGIGDAAALVGIDGEGMTTMMVNLAKGLNPLSALDGTNLLKVGGSLIAIGAGMAAVFGVDWIKGIGDWVGSFFGRSDDDDIFSKTARSLAKLNGIDLDYKNVDAMNVAGDAFNNLATGVMNLNSVNFDDYEDQMLSFAKSTAKTIYLMNAMWEGSKIGSGWFDGLPEMDFAPGLKVGHIEDVTSQLKGISQIAGVPQNTVGQTITNQTSQLNNISSMVSPIVISSPSTTNVSNGTMAVSWGGGISTMDSFDQGTR